MLKKLLSLVTFSFFNENPDFPATGELDEFPKEVFEEGRRMKTLISSSEIKKQIAKDVCRQGINLETSYQMLKEANYRKFTQTEKEPTKTLFQNQKKQKQMNTVSL